MKRDVCYSDMYVPNPILILNLKHLMITEVMFDQQILFSGLRCKEFFIAGKKVCGRPDVYWKKKHFPSIQWAYFIIGLMLHFCLLVLLLLPKMYGFLSELTTLSNEVIDEKVENFISSCPDDLESWRTHWRLSCLSQLRAPRNRLWTNLYSWPCTSLRHRCVCLRRFQTSTLRCASVCAWCYCCPMPITSSGERSFSNLGRVKGDLCDLQWGRKS